MNIQIQTFGHSSVTPGRQFSAAFRGGRRLFILVFDARNLRLLDANENATQQYGFERDEFLQMTLKDLVPRARFSRLLRFVRNMPEQLMSTIVCAHLKKDGSSMPVEMQCYKFLFQGQPAVVALIREITGSPQLGSILARVAHAAPTGRTAAADIISRVDRRLMYLELRREIDRLAGQSADAIRQSGAGTGDPDWVAGACPASAAADLTNPRENGWFMGWGARLGWRRAGHPQGVQPETLSGPPDGNSGRA